MSEEAYERFSELAREYLDTVSKDGPRLSELADTFLWKQALENMLGGAVHYDDLKLPRYPGLLLSGKPGNGRHTYADAYVQSVCSNEMCFEKAVFIRLRAEDFHEKQLKSPEDIRSFVSALFDTCGMTARQAFLIFDQMEHYRELTLICNCIADAYASMETDKIHSVCIIDDEKKIPRELSGLLFPCRCADPEESLRKLYFENNLSYTVEDWANGSGNLRTVKLKLQDITTDRLAELTQGFSYGRLGELLQLFKMTSAGKTLGSEPVCTLSISEQTVLQYISMLRPEPKEGQARMVYVNAPAFSAAKGPEAGYHGTGRTESLEQGKTEGPKGDVSRLIGKGGSRSVTENMELIDFIRPLN